MDPIIQLSSVTKRFGREIALDNVSFEVPRGVVFALLGENGAGKTTSIRCMLGLNEPDAGDIKVLGLDSRREHLKIRQMVGYMPDRPTLYDWMTVAELGWFTAGFYGGEFLSRFEQLAKQHELPLDRPLKALSKGMLAKVALSLALAHDPELLILDEPTSGLDPLVRREFLEQMVDRAAAGKTVFLSSHQIAEVERVADMVAILRGGKLVVVEKLEVLKDQIRELTFTLADDLPEPPRVPGEVLRQQRRARQWQLHARHLSDSDIAAVRIVTGVVDLEVRRPSLEEVYVAFMRGNSTTSAVTPNTEVPE